ncbi:flagellar biosynthesis protein FlhB [Microvirga thermotolerans]|uniref:Flagellar biosynthetic protein FlhB n=1 Tax=Microvirga thermotolerans TaxID=2651334 RepID=A0A5P9JXT0_9HYPH|nr:flagellar biosynthesis protein FlhB [Microvirga thermotolerans]QFU17662.1 flagellar biosynthesis protein FlhB [Microvirga thermotolerans]
MADAEDKESKTEPATDKKIRDAIEKGNIPVSKELPVFSSIVALLIILVFITKQNAANLIGKLSIFLDDPRKFSLVTGGDATLLIQSLALEVGRFLTPIIVVLTLTGLTSSILQNLPQVVYERIRPQWSRISPMAGWSRIFGKSGFVEFLKAVFKFFTIAIVCLLLLKSEQYKVVNAMFSDPSLVPEMILTMAIRLVSAVSIATIVLVAGDLIWARFRWHRDLRMSRQEIKDEFKQMEGDPLIKSRLRSLAQDRARRRMLAAVPRATVVIANPTHYAIALRYDRQETSAPVVLAKGTDLIALKIRETAEKHGVPVVEDKALARSMYDHVEVDRMIPPDFYRAVAQILFYIFTRSK